ncbi:MAG: prolyl oligopeptidase family serine peptidase [Zavarzinella sp.]
MRVLSYLAIAAMTFCPTLMWAQAAPTSQKQIEDLEKQIADLKKRLAELKAPPTKKTLSLADADLWENVLSQDIAPNGKWVAVGVGNQKKNRILLTSVETGKVTTITTDIARGNPGFSEDSNFFVCTASKAGTSQLIFVELANGKQTILDNISSYKLSKGTPTWLALRPSPKKSASPPAPGATGPIAASAGTNRDLILHDLKTGKSIPLGNISDFEFNKTGNLLAMIVTTDAGVGSGVQIFDTTSAALTMLESSSSSYSSLNWNKEGTALTVMKSFEDKELKNEKYYGILGVKFTGKQPEIITFDPKQEKTFPKDMGLVTQRQPRWTEDLQGFVFGIKTQEKKEATKPAPKAPAKTDNPPKSTTAAPAPNNPNRPAVVVWHWKDSRLQPKQALDASRDKNENYLAWYSLKTKKTVALGSEDAPQVGITAKDQYAYASITAPYDLQASLDGISYRNIDQVDLATGKRTNILTKIRWFFGSSNDGKGLLYYQDGNYWYYSFAGKKSVNITKASTTSFINTEDDHNVDRPPTRFMGWAKDGQSVFISDNWDIWQIPVTGDAGTNLTVNGKKDGIRYQSILDLNPESEGIDPAQPIYFPYVVQKTKKNGYVRRLPGSATLTTIVEGDADFTRLAKAKNADLFTYQKTTAIDSPNIFQVDGTFKNAKQLTTTNPQQKDYLWMAGTRVLHYESFDKKPLQAALYLPANYQAGKKYPTVVYIYEKLSDRIHSYSPPSSSAFNVSIYTSNGYAVLMPDITYEINNPGGSSVKCILAALDAAEKTGVVDPQKMALHGHSWGGYQTAYAITQTKRFKAAIAGAPLTNLISMYSSMYWNSGIANQPIFESSQGRFTAGYWALQDAYIRNSPVFNAQNVETPLLLLHNDKDGAVDFTQGVEYFNTLRRLEKPVVMLQYKGENHGLAVESNRKDYAIRMREFFDHHLQGKSAPDWWKEGVPHLKLEDHLKSRPLK